jgi:hypothetical protein
MPLKTLGLIGPRAIGERVCHGGTSCTNMTIGGTDPVPPLVMEMQTGSTNNHLSQIFFVLAAPMYTVANGKCV